MRQTAASGRFIVNNPIDSFCEKWERDHNTGCWNWISKAKRKHYGSFCSTALGSEHIGAHRASWLIFRCDEPIGDKYVLHKCDNKLCVNPSHLFLGTQSENMQDMMKKGRKGNRGKKWARHGVENKKAKLNDDKVREMRLLHSQGWNGPKLAERFGVHPSVAWDVVKRKTWKHVK